MDTAHSSKTISATHSLLPNSVNSAFLRRSMRVGFWFGFVVLIFFLFSFWFSVFCRWFHFCSVLFFLSLLLVVSVWGCLGGGMWGNWSCFIGEGGR